MSLGQNREDSPMQRDAVARMKFRWNELWFALPLTLLEIGLLVVTVAVDGFLPLQQAVLIGLFLYLLISGIAGYQFGIQGHRRMWQSAWAGFRVGLATCAFCLLLSVVYLIIAFITYNNEPTPANPHNHHLPGIALFIEIAVFGILTLLNGAGSLLSAVGGLIGGALAIWRSKAKRRAKEVQA
jgi:hypothetical protein